MSARALGRVVVTGAGGFIGRRLAERLAALGADVRAWARAEVDLLDRAAVAAALDRDTPDTVFHLASAGVGAARAHDPAVLGSEVRMIDALVAHLADGARLVYAGSMSEYGRSGVLAEGDRCTPRTAYGIAKLAAGHFAAAYGARRGLGVCHARLFGIYGPGEAPQRLFPLLLARLRAHQPVPLSDGAQRRDFVHVDDAVEALIALSALAEPPPLVNVGTGQAVAIREVAQWLADAVGAPRELLQFGAHPRSPGDEDLLQADVSILSEATGVVPPQRLAPGFALALVSG